jgi:hypothetical protein
MDSQKLQAKNVIYSQWNLLNYLKSYLSKISNDKTVENALNNEFAHFLQKFQPTIYGPTDFWKYFNSLSPSLFKELQLFNKKENSLKKIEETRDNVKIQKVAKWKEKEIIISEESVASRTQQILALLLNARSQESILNRIEDLNNHLNKYPQAKHIAVKVRPNHLKYLCHLSYEFNVFRTMRSVYY